MIDLVVPAELAREIRLKAEMEGVAVETVLEAAWRHYQMLANRRKIKSETVWWNNQPEGERARYKGKYIAVHQQAVVDYDSDRVALHGRIRAKYGRTAVLIIPAEGPRGIRILSPRLESR